MALILLSSLTFCLETVRQYQTPKLLLWYADVEIVAIVVFTVEYVFRAICCPNKARRCAALVSRSPEPPSPEPPSPEPPSLLAP